MTDDITSMTVNRRGLLLGGLAAAGGTAALVAQQALAQEHIGHTMTPATAARPDAWAADTYTTEAHVGGHGDMMTVGAVDNERNGFDPVAMLTDWDTGTVSTLPDGQDAARPSRSRRSTRRSRSRRACSFPAWTYNGRVPGPTLRCDGGRAAARSSSATVGSHPHSMHFHGIHSARMDGVPGAGLIEPGEEFIYEFDALPFGCHLYHCHALPLKRHIHKGMYGAFIIDPDPARHPEARRRRARRGCSARPRTRAGRRW